MIPTSILTLIIAKSGRGKSYSIKNLNPEETFIINVSGQILPFDNVGNFKYLKNEDTFIGVNTLIDMANKDTKIKNLVIDDSYILIVNEFIDKATVKGFEKWNVLAKNVVKLLQKCSHLRSDLHVFYLAHEETGDYERKMKVMGKILEDKIVPEFLAAIVLFGELERVDGKAYYYFVTQGDGITTAKSPPMMFPEKIPNDLRLVSARITEYYNNISLEDSKLDFTIT